MQSGIRPYVVQHIVVNIHYNLFFFFELHRLPVYDTDSTQNYNRGHCQQFNPTCHSFVAWQDYSKFSLPLFPSFLTVLLETHGFLIYFLSVNGKANRKNFDYISSLRILFSLFSNSISRKFYVLLSHKHRKTN